MLSHYGALVALPIVWFLARAARSWREARWTLPTVWFVIPFVFFTFVRTKMVCYTMFAAPALFVMSAAFVAAACTRAAPRTLTALAALLLLLVAAPLARPQGDIFPTEPPATKQRNGPRVEAPRKHVPIPGRCSSTPRRSKRCSYTSGTAYPDLPTTSRSTN